MVKSEFLMGNVPSHSQFTIQNSLFTIKSRLAPHTSSPSLDAQVLLAHITNKSRTWLLSHPEIPLSSNELHNLEDALQKLESGLPLPYILGEWEFFGLKFKVTPDVLIPRPETEILVETALEWFRQTFPLQRCEENREAHKEIPKKSSSRSLRNLSVLRGENSSQAICAADIGTGSGCITISLAIHGPDLRLIATDISPAALKIAHHNAETHGVSDRIIFLETDLLNTQYPLSNIHLLTANLPYIPTSTLHTLEVYGREPTLALDGGPDGLSLIERLLAQAATHLAPSGLMLLEIESTQGVSALALARHYFPDAEIHVKPDLAGHDRLLCIQTPPIPTESPKL